MKIHNLMEDIVRSGVESVCETLAREPDHGGVCICSQCRLDVICYVLNRLEPKYFVSSRGLARESTFPLKNQQKKNDIITLIFDAFKVVSGNKRATSDHNVHAAKAPVKSLDGAAAVFNLTVIVGRILNGQNFASLSDVELSLYHEGALVEMCNPNWQNPCLLNINMEGNFSFWPKAFKTKKANEQKTFEFLLKANAEGFEPLEHHFDAPLKSDKNAINSLTLERTLALPSLYMFPV